MRKYFKPKNIAKRDILTRLDKEICPWSLLEAYVESSAGHFKPDDLQDLRDCITSKSVSGYLAVSGRLESYAQVYHKDSDVAQVFAHRQVSALLKKYPFRDSDLSQSPRAAAIDKWQQCEEMCRVTNARLGSLSLADLPQWFLKARAQCARVLGELTPEKIMKMISHGGHGPGATLSSRGNRVSAYYKYADLPYTVTTKARLYAYAAISADPKWIDFLESTGRRSRIPLPGSPLFQKELMLLEDVVEVADSDKVTFVPKDCRSDRPIAVGANMNIFMQLGVKDYLEQRLKRFGVDLTDQTKNQRYSYFGSLFRQESHNSFSTIDLASASDTISTEIVKLLLPGDWFAFLSDLRHETGLIEGKVHSYEKFAAMGNGFTFPLESLIFYCICYGAIIDNGLPCTSNDIAVFGDDIIVREKAVPHVIPALEWAGFSVNTEKSFLSGVFKESCGTDYFLGHLVRPFYLKREVCTYEDIYFVCNQTSSKAVRFDFGTSLLSIFKAALSKIPEEHRTYGPFSSGSLNDDRSGQHSTNSSHLAVPLSYLNRRGLRPWLTLKERRTLSHSKLLSLDNDYQTAVAIVTVRTARSFKARQTVNYMIRLRDLELPSLGNPSYLKEDLKLIIDSSTKTTSRRNSFSVSQRIVPVSNWNGTLSREAQYKSLVFLLD